MHLAFLLREAVIPGNHSISANVLELAYSELRVHLQCFPLVKKEKRPLIPSATYAGEYLQYNYFKLPTAIQQTCYVLTSSPTQSALPSSAQTKTRQRATQVLRAGGRRVRKWLVGSCPAPTTAAPWYASQKPPWRLPKNRAAGCIPAERPGSRGVTRWQCRKLPSPPGRMSRVQDRL